jgi:hypothetical protein
LAFNPWGFVGNETTAIPVLLEKLAVGRSLRAALVTIDAIASFVGGSGSISASPSDPLPSFPIGLGTKECAGMPSKALR